MNTKELDMLGLDEVDGEESYFHFTRKENFYDNEIGPGIFSMNGITSMPRSRPHIVGSDKNNYCIYFVKGFAGILELIDVWVRYEYDKEAIRQGKPLGYCNNYSDEVWLEVYKKMDEYFRNCKYLKLDLIPGNNPNNSDFDPEGIDIKKEKYFFGESINEYAKWEYGKNTNYHSKVMDRWNMNTYAGFKVIPLDKIHFLKDSNGNDDALSIILEVYQKYRLKVKNVDSLDGLINYLNCQ